MIKLHPYQKKLLDEINNIPAVKALLKMIFDVYPKTVLQEYRSGLPTASKRQRSKHQSIMEQRLQMEVYIEEQIAVLAGINLIELANEVNHENKKENSEKGIDNVDEASIM